MNDIWEVIVTRWPTPGHVVKSVIDYDTFEEAKQYALVKRRYKCKITIIHRYEVEETIYDELSV